MLEAVNVGKPSLAANYVFARVSLALFQATVQPLTFSFHIQQHCLLTKSSEMSSTKPKLVCIDLCWHVSSFVIGNANCPSLPDVAPYLRR